MKKFALLLVFVMVFASSGSAFAWGNRTGSRTGDAAVYGVAGGVVAYSIAGALLCPPVGVALGLGALGAGAYGALWEDKTLVTDTVFAGVIPAVSGVVAVELPAVAGWTLGIGAGEAVALPFTRATEAIADEWKKPDPEKTINVADWAY